MQIHQVKLLSYFSAVEKNEIFWPEFSPLFLLSGGDQLDPAATRDLMTFSTGVRYCPGKDMAFANSFVVLGTMLLRYDFNMVQQPEDWVPQRGLTLKPKHYTISLSHV